PTAAPTDDGQPSPATKRSNRRKYVRDYLHWLRPHRYAVGAVFLLALIAGALQMVEPLFMRFIIDRVLLNKGLDAAARLHRLQLAGVAFLAVIIVSNAFGAVKDYRQRLLNVGVMLSLRRSLFDRLLNLPLPKLWDMKTGGILSRLTGDIDTTTGLLQMAMVSPAVSIIRLILAVAVLVSLNWRLALTALAIIPGVVLMSLTFARRVRPIYRSLRKDAEEIDGRVGETFSGIRIVRAFRAETRELDASEAKTAPRRLRRMPFENVEFEYVQDRPVVREFDVAVSAGSVIALVGRSGAGKTTVTALVALFHDPTRGRIVRNGSDI